MANNNKKESLRLPNLTKEEWELKKNDIIKNDTEYDSFISQGITASDLERALNKTKR